MTTAPNVSVTQPLPLTDTYGQVTYAGRTEPNPASVVLVKGEFGHAFQRHFSDGLWHATRGSRGRTWDEMLLNRNMVLVYGAPERGH